MTGKLKGRCAVVTGGLTGQGLAIAEALAAEGANVAVGSREAMRWQGSPEPDHIADIRTRLSAYGGKVYIGPLDVRAPDVIAQFADAADAVCGPADILVNSAGMTTEQPVSGHSEDLWLKIIDTNLNGAFRMTRTYLPGMIARKWGPHNQYRLDGCERGLEGQSRLLRLEIRPARPYALRGARRRAPWRDLCDDQPDLGRNRIDAQECPRTRRARG